MGHVSFLCKLRSPYVNNAEKYLRKIRYILSELELVRSLKTSPCLSTTEDAAKDCPVSRIRNFSIIAHVDHGKSTLADRLLEITGAIGHDSGNQVLDKLQVEKERGITVKAQTASLNYHYVGDRKIPQGQYLLNLIDTPGHVDFSGEVSRSLLACQGALLIVDANKGVQAQTAANYRLAITKGLTIIPVINKIDLKNADPERVYGQLKTLFDIDKNSVLKVSAKHGDGVEDVLKAIVKRIPSPPARLREPFRGLLFDSWFDRHRGAVLLLYIHDGSLSVGDQITSVNSGRSYEVKSLGMLRPQEEAHQTLSAGQVGYMTCNMRSPSEVCIGDTFHKKDEAVEQLPDLKKATPLVFAGIYPNDQSQYLALRSALEKLVLNDSTVSMVPDSSPALGQGWRLGFLGLLHMEVFGQRLEQEYGAEPVITAPSVTYKAKIMGAKNIKKYGKDEISFSNPTHFPDVQIISELYEPIVTATIITPDVYMGSIISLCVDRRGVQISSVNIDDERVMLQFSMPLNEIIVDFHDLIKSVSSGYASFDYETSGYAPSKLVKVNILLNGNIVEELSTICHVSKSARVGYQLCTKLKDLIPRQLFQVAVQASVGSKVVARENIKALRKDVTAKCYGGDISRKMKLLKRQAEGKKKMRMIGNIEVPKHTFISVLKR
ncbi:translation factor GUF1 homolog, mitochondrial [Ischnura elegans]|uniref:translation factor GUF1 homolog, mitochondrial n=1 Tax=Ischnura elegans TaxID=197161 RepID=UPI001ED86F96|nr:translation factor GUF1 homolog, mitochondrial [Ischnura elegans]